MSGSNGKWFYITGCDSGFGAMVIKMLEAAGHNVFAGCFLDATVKKLQAESKRIVPISLDVTNDDSVAAAAKLIREKLGSSGQLDGLVNNAAILVTPAPVELTPLSDFRKMYEVNVIGIVRVTQSVLPLIRKSQGRIINVASIAGRVGLPGQPAYCASKHAVEAVSDVLRYDMEAWGVTVHIIEPGVFPNTGLYNTFRSDVEKMWPKLPQQLQDDYGEEYKNGYLAQTDGVLKDLSTADSSYVPKAMMHALTDSRPRYRYRVGWDSKYVVTLLELLPERWLSAVFSAPVPGQPKAVMPKTSPANGRQLASRRYNWGTGKWWAFFVIVLFLWKRGNISLRARR